MIPEERRQKLIKKLQTNGICTINSLVDDFEVSRVTIQRDIDLLKKQGLVFKIHGGVKIKKDEKDIETIFTVRLNENYEKKLIIARKGQEYVSDGETLFLDSSTSVFIFAQQLFKRRFSNLNIITNSPAIIDEAIKSNTNINVMATGGQLDTEFQIFKGSWVIEFLEQINIDKAFISSGGISAEQRITTTSRDLANTLNLIIGKVNEVNLLVDSSKFSKTAMINISDIGDFKRIITDDGFDEKTCPNLTNLIIAE